MKALNDILMPCHCENPELVEGNGQSRNAPTLFWIIQSSWIMTIEKSLPNPYTCVIARSLLPACPVRCKSYGVIARNPELVEGDEAISRRRVMPKYHQNCFANPNNDNSGTLEC